MLISVINRQLCRVIGSRSSRASIQAAELPSTLDPALRGVARGAGG